MSRPLREMELDRPSAARIQDALLGGGHNFGVDREFVQRAERLLPGLTRSVQESRAFLWRVVDELAARGVRQFLDLGSGIPTIGHVHEVARRRTDDFRVRYVDNEPLTVAHSQPLLADEPRAEIVLGDIRDAGAVLEDTGQLDLGQPMALLLCSALHYLPDSDDPASLVATYRRALAPGSHLVITHLAIDDDPEPVRMLEKLHADTSDPLFARDSAAATVLFGDSELLDPGVVQLRDWRPRRYEASPAGKYRMLRGGVARIP